MTKMRWFPLILAATALGCASEPPSVSGVDPSTGPAGTTLTITGDHLTQDVTVKVGGQPLADATLVDAQTIRGQVPEGLEAGSVDVSVVDGQGRQMKRSDAFVVASTAPPEHPCRSSEKRFTAIPPDGSVVKIDRHLEGGKVDRKSFSTGQIQAIELRRIPLPDAVPAPSDREEDAAPAPMCSAIYLLLEGDKGRVLFDADDAVDLKGQAQKIAQGLGKRLVLAQGMPE